MKERKIEQLQDALLLSFPFLVVLITIPVQLYLPNQTEFQYEHEVPLLFLVIFLAFFSIAYVALKKIDFNSRIIVIPIFFYFGLYLHLSHLFIPAQTGQLIGKDELEAIAEPLFLTLMEIILFLAIGAIALKIPWNKVKNIGSLYLLLTLVATIGLFLAQIHRPGKTESLLAQDVSKNNFAGCNIYHLIFDAFDSTLFEKMINAKDIRGKFNGFIFYKNAICNYTTTSLSIPSLMTGKFLDGEIEADDFNSLSNGIIDSLKDKGYRISQYDMYSSSHEETDYWVSSDSIDKNLNRKLNILKLADLSILVVAPNFLQNECFENGKGVVSRLVGLMTRLPNWHDKNPVISLAMIKKILDDESLRATGGEYVYAHLMIPHPPYVFDQECNFIGSQSTAIQTREGRVNLINQNFCALNQIIKILDHLKKEQKFKSSLIIIQSDHGELKRENPLLLVKAPEISSDPMEISNDFVHFLDIAPTILEAADLKKNHLEGRSLISSELLETRDLPMAIGLSKSKEFLHYTWRDGQVLKKNTTIIRTDLD